MQTLKNFNFEKDDINTKTSIDEVSIESINKKVLIDDRVTKKFGFGKEINVYYFESLFHAIDNQELYFINFLPKEYEYNFSLKTNLDILFKDVHKLIKNIQPIHSMDNNKRYKRFINIMNEFINFEDDMIIFEFRFTNTLKIRDSLRVFGYYRINRNDSLNLFLLDIHHLVFPDDINNSYDKVKKICCNHSLKDWYSDFYKRIVK